MTQFPVENVSDLQQEPAIDNIIAHHSYLKCLQFEQNCLRCWSNMISDQIMGEARQVQEQFSRMMRMQEQQQQQQQTNAWTCAQAQQRMQAA